MYVCMYIYIYIHVHIYIYTYIHIYTCILSQPSLSQPNKFLTREAVGRRSRFHKVKAYERQENWQHVACVLVHR